jgi:hypothetical protein
MKSGMSTWCTYPIGIQKNSAKGVGFFQIGGGIAGDFPICVVPMFTKIWKCQTFILAFLSNFRFNYQLWFVFWSCSE